MESEKRTNSSKSNLICRPNMVRLAGSIVSSIVTWSVSHHSFFLISKFQFQIPTFQSFFFNISNINHSFFLNLSPSILGTRNSKVIILFGGPKMVEHAGTSIQHDSLTARCIG